MKKIKISIIAFGLIAAGAACTGKNDASNNSKVTGKGSDFKVEAESFADLQLLRYEVPGWDKLDARQQELAYYLYNAAVAGRDIIYDQRGKYNLTVRKTLEALLENEKIVKSGDNYEKLKAYAGRVFFSNGIYHHYSNDKMIPECSFEYFSEQIKSCDLASLPLAQGESVESFLATMKKVIFDPKFEPKMVDLRPDVDNVVSSHNNFYEGVTAAEVEAFYAKFPESGNQPEWGLNSKLVKTDGKLTEKVWKSGGMYGKAIDKMIYWLEKAIPLAENGNQKKAFELLVEYYKTGDLKKWDEYNIAWVSDTTGVIDYANGFIEVYNDALGKKGSYEAVLSIKDFEATKRIKAISDAAQWFEDNSPLMPEHKKKEVKGISAKVINVIFESGDAAPSTPIGINLPNSDWLRKEHGSKSVSLGNIVDAYTASSAKSGFLDEFVVNKEVADRIRKYGELGSNLHTDMHECIGHASGQINPGVATPDKTLKSYASTLEEARADLVALYYILDPKLVEIGVMPNLEVGKAEYDNYMMNGMISQITRLKLGDDIEEAHMRNRATNAYWVYEKGKKDNVVEMVKKNGKTYVQINDYEKLRKLFGDLLREIQRIKSEGDYAAGKALVETYGVKVDPALHKEVLERFAKLNIKPYKGFIQPRLVAEMEGDKVKRVKLEYPTNFYDQMMEYGKKYNFLPTIN